MSPATYARVDQVRRQEALAEADRARSATAAARLASAPPNPERAARVRSVLRDVAAAVAGVGIGLVMR